MLFYAARILPGDLFQDNIINFYEQFFEHFHKKKGVLFIMQYNFEKNRKRIRAERKEKNGHKIC